MKIAIVTDSNSGITQKQAQAQLAQMEQQMKEKLLEISK